MAIELGLHSSSNNPVLCGARETETRQRVFWTAYILEITLAYNLGRPPSIGEEHITIALPNQSATGMTSILHIKHRQIQHRLISKVYSANAKATRLEAQAQIASLQGELDNWKTEMSSLIDEDFAPYSHEYVSEVVCMSPRLTLTQLLASSISWHKLRLAQSKPALPKPSYGFDKNVSPISWRLHNRCDEGFAAQRCATLLDAYTRSAVCRSDSASHCTPERREFRCPR